MSSTFYPFYKKRNLNTLRSVCSNGQSVWCSIFFFTLFIWLLISPISLEAQVKLPNQKISFDVANQTIPDALWSLSNQTKIPISFSDHFFSDQVYSYQFDNQTLKTILDALLQKTNTDYEYDGYQILIIKKNPPKKFTVSGYLEDKVSGERLIGANVSLFGSTQGTMTNEYGFFSINLEGEKSELHFSYLGYETLVQKIKASTNQHLNLSLNPNLTLAEVIVTGTDSLFNSAQQVFATNEISAIELKYFSSLGGEGDVLRSLQQLPGVQSGTDGLGGMYVRGGNADQNLVLFDGVRIYNPFHALGLFSIFDNKMIRKVNFYNGAIPARYSGRISSVVDVRTKEGNNKAFQGEATIGLLASKLTLEGPLKKEKGAFLISGRRTHLDYFLKNYSERQRARQNQSGSFNYAFAEIMGKLNYTVSSKDRLYFSFYLGNDFFDNNTINRDTTSMTIFSTRTEQTLKWGNKLGVFRWNRQLGNKLFSNFTLNYSTFNFDSDNWLQFSDTNENTELLFSQKTLYQSEIHDLSTRLDFNCSPSNDHYIRFGVGARQSDFFPGQISAKSNDLLLEESGVLPDSLANTPAIRGHEAFFYAEDEWKITPNLQLNYGISNVLSTSKDKAYISLEPRLSLQWQYNAVWKFHSSMSRTNQFFHVLTQSGSGLPNDIWIPSTANIRPQQAWIFDGGIGCTMDYFSINTTGYYKSIQHLLDFRENTSDSDGIGVITANQWEQQVREGSGQSYGVETRFKYASKNHKIWLNYTWSKTNRQFESINNGQPYPFRYDLRHILNLHFYQVLHPNWILSGSWNFKSGSKITLAEQHWEYYSFNQGGYSPVVVYGDKNSFTMPAYHQLDLRIEYKKKKEKLEWSALVGIYNLYNRRNLSYIRTEYDVVTNTNSYVGISFIPILPYFSFNIKIP